MPWRLRADLQRFKKLTMGGTLIMGRRTYDSIGRPLPGRRSIVITRNPDWQAAGVLRAKDPAESLKLARQSPRDLDAPGESPPPSTGPTASRDVYIVGGAEIYRQLLPECDEIWLTRVWSTVSGDTTLRIELSNFRQIEQTRLPATAKDSVPTEFLRWRRRNS
ncbi:MAG: dihydrofolate reductase [Novipirellula sp. JB048]